MDSPRSAPRSPLATPAKEETTSSNAKQGTPLRPVEDATADSDDEEDEGPSLETMRAIGRYVPSSSLQHLTDQFPGTRRQVQRAPTTGSSAGPAKIVIPKRGEKDFEPLDETVTIQEKMLRESRQALFDGLSGVRGTSSKNISHATMSSQSPFPQVQLVRGNLFLTLGHTIRPPYDPTKGKSPAHNTSSETPLPPTTTTTGNTSSMELLPEEALYLLERGSLQIWCAPSAYDPLSTPNPNPNEGAFEWDEGVQGFKGCVEMTVLEGFSRFIGRDGLTLERYQVYAGLKRLGYTVQRTERFLPARFRKVSVPEGVVVEGKRRMGVMEVRRAVGGLWRWLVGPWRWMMDGFRRIFGSLRGGREEGGSLLGKVTATGYGALYEKLRIIPSGHTHPSTISPTAAPHPPSEDPFKSLDVNPYLPFFHVWKPITHWTRAKWDRGSAEGLRSLPPDFWIAVVDARSVPFPTLPQMEEIFPLLPELPTPVMRPRGTGSATAGKPTNPAAATTTPSSSPSPLVSARIIQWFRSFSVKKPAGPQVNTFLALKQGDRSLIVAVVDGGNVGWSRLGRGGFQEHVMVPNEML